MPITSTGTTANDFRYSGERLDGSIGLYDLRARYYNQATGRFWSADPIETRGCSPLGYNRYIYANDEPVDLDDPTGEQAIIEYLLLYHWIQGFQVHPGFELPFPPCASKGNAGPPKFKGFSTDDEVQMNQAVSHAANKLRNTCCAGPDSPQIADAIENATYVFKPKSKYCGDVGPLGVLRMRHVVTIGPAAFGPGCCSLL